jgi:hypothetical protein
VHHEGTATSTYGVNVAVHDFSLGHWNKACLVITFEITVSDTNTVFLIFGD